LEKINIEDEIKRVILNYQSNCKGQIGEALAYKWLKTQGYEVIFFNEFESFLSLNYKQEKEYYGRNLEPHLFFGESTPRVRWTQEVYDNRLKNLNMKRDMRKKFKRKLGVKFWNGLKKLSLEYPVDMIAHKNGVSYLVEVKSSKNKITPSKFWHNDKTQKLRVEKFVSKGLNLLKIAVQIEIDVDISYDNPYFVK